MPGNTEHPGLFGHQRNWWNSDDSDERLFSIVWFLNSLLSYLLFFSFFFFVFCFFLPSGYRFTMSRVTQAGRPPSLLWQTKTFCCTRQRPPARRSGPHLTRATPSSPLGKPPLLNTMLLMIWTGVLSPPLDTTAPQTVTSCILCIADHCLLSRWLHRLVHSGKHTSTVGGNDILTLGTRSGTRQGVEAHVLRVEMQRDLSTWSRVLVQGAHTAAALVKEVSCRK